MNDVPNEPHGWPPMSSDAPPIGWFALVLSEKNLYRGYYLQEGMDGRAALTWLADIGVLSAEQTSAALMARDVSAIEGIIETSLEHLSLVITMDPMSPVTSVYGAALAHVIDHPFFIIDYSSDAIRFIKIALANTCEQARDFAMKYPPIQAIEALQQYRPTGTTLH